MKVAIVGCRPKWILDPERVRTRVQQLVATLPRDTIVVSGGAAGVDTWAAEAADEQGLVVVTYEPDWHPGGVYDPRAGFKRNTLIVDQADEVHAFWDGKSPGTGDTIRKAKLAGKSVLVYPVT